jgi:hypothetical protein
LGESNRNRKIFRADFKKSTKKLLTNGSVRFTIIETLEEMFLRHPRMVFSSARKEVGKDASAF